MLKTTHQTYTKQTIKNISVLNKAKQVLNHNLLLILQCSIVLPNLITVQKFGEITTTVQSILQKRAMRVIHNACYLDHTHLLLLQSKLLKFTDIVKFQTAQIMGKANYNLLPQNIQKLFRDGEKGYQLREKHY